MTASRNLRDLKFAGRGFILSGVLAPNLFATLGILLAYTYAHPTDTHFTWGPGLRQPSPGHPGFRPDDLRG